MMEQCNVEYSSFVNLTRGGLYLRSTLIVHVQFCLFSYCSNSAGGGSIDAKCNYINFIKNCIEYGFCTGAHPAIYTESSDVSLNYTSVTFCSYKSGGSYDTLYFRYGSVCAGNNNVSSCIGTQSTGIQGTSNENFVSFYFLGADGKGDSSIEMYTQTITPVFVKTVLVNNTCSSGIIYLPSTALIQFIDAIFSGNNRKLISVGKISLTNCYYYSKISSGISADTIGLTVIDSPTISWLTLNFNTYHCHVRNIMAECSKKNNNQKRYKGNPLLLLFFLNCIF